MLKVKPDVIVKFNELNRLHNIGLLVIRSLYQKRNQSKKIKSSGCSPLFETPIREIYINGQPINSIEDRRHELSDDFEVMTIPEWVRVFSGHEDRTVQNTTPEEIVEIIDRLFESNRLHMDLLMKANEPGLSINKIHKVTGIGRAYLTKVYKEAVDKVKTELNND